jgi:hypothetical protein
VLQRHLSGALRVLTPSPRSCGSERQISWNQAGNGYSFVTTTGTLNKYGDDESDGPVLAKAGSYFVNVTGKANISAYTSGGAGFCALDLVHGNTVHKFIFEIFSPWSYPAPASDIDNSYPVGSSGMIRVAPSQAGYQLMLECFDNSFNIVPMMKATWLVSPVSATAGAKVMTAHSVLGPAGFRPRPPRGN